MIRFALASIVTAFDQTTIGSKVMDKDRFRALLTEAVENHDPATDRAPGQHFVQMPEGALPTVSAGVGRRTSRVAHYVVREHRGHVSAFLRREHAARATGLAVIVYTKGAYCADPEVDEAEVARVDYATHIIVAVLAFAGPRPPLTPHRFVKNLAGGNKEALAWTADEIRAKADIITGYDDEWCVVAD